MTSFMGANELKIEPEIDPPAELLAHRPTYKSYKKKFLKTRHAFKERMRECNGLFDEEQRAVKLTRRLQEQNDQLLELLLDINGSARIPPSLSYDLRSPVLSPSDVPALTPDKSPAQDIREAQDVRAALQEAKAELESGQIGAAEYQDIEASLSAMIAQPSLTNLSKISHSILQGENAVPSDLLPDSLKEDSPAGYLSPDHEEEYLSTLDTYLETAPQDAPYLPPKIKPTDKERERDMQLHNPMSVYNWLCRNRQEIFMTSQGEDEHKEKPAKTIPSSKAKSSPRPTPVPSRGSKRKGAGEAVAAAVMKHEEEMLDEEGNVVVPAVEAMDSKKRKRKGEDDAYRPKGGSSRPKKRSRASTGLKERSGDGDEEL